MTKNAKRTPPIFRAYMETAKYEFDAYGRTDAEARRILKDAFYAHLKQCIPGITAEALRENWAYYNDGGSVCCYEIQVGAAYRDRDRIEVQP